MKLFLKQFLNIKQLKYANTNQYNITDYYWVRLNDDDAFINDKFCEKFLLLLDALKVKLFSYYKISDLSEEEAQKKIKKEVPVVQIDDTFDVKGFVYLNEFEINTPKIA